MLFANFLRTWSLIRSSFLFALLPFTSLWSTCSWSVTSYPPLLLSKQRLWEKTHLPRLAWWIADSIRTNVWAFRLSLVLSPPWASSVRMWLQMGSGRRHTSSMPFSSALGLHNFMDDSSFYCLLLSFYRCLYFHQLEIQIETFFWTLILSSTSFFPLFSYFFSLLVQNSIRISCFHELHSFFFHSFLYGLQFGFHTSYHTSWLNPLFPKALLCIIILKFNLCDPKGLHSCSHWKSLQV